MKAAGVILVFLGVIAIGAQASNSALPTTEALFKADILLIFAHPDDETGDVAAYLARAIFDQHRRVAVVCLTRGDAGSNEAGHEYGKALALEREIEGRRALGWLGI